MNTAFLEWFRKNKAETNLERTDRELEKQAAEFERKAKNIEALRRTSGWKEYDKFMNERIEMLRVKRDYLEAGSADDVMTKAYIAAYQDILSFSNNG